MTISPLLVQKLDQTSQLRSLARKSASAMDSLRRFDSPDCVLKKLPRKISPTAAAIEPVTFRKRLPTTNLLFLVCPAARKRVTRRSSRSAGGASEEIAPRAQ